MSLQRRLWKAVFLNQLYHKISILKISRTSDQRKPNWEALICGMKSKPLISVKLLSNESVRNQFQAHLNKKRICLVYRSLASQEETTVSGMDEPRSSNDGESTVCPPSIPLCLSRVSFILHTGSRYEVGSTATDCPTPHLPSSAIPTKKRLLSPHVHIQMP